MIYRSNHYGTLMKDDHPVYRYDHEVDLTDIKRFVKDRHKRHRSQVCIHELGVGKHRFDFLSLNPYTHHVRILEYKVDRADLDGDKKHLDYMHYCNTLAFVTPLGLVNVDDLKDKALGLMQVFRWKRRSGDRNRWRLGAIWLRRPRGKRLETERYYRIVDMMLARVVQGRKGDLF